MSDAELDKRISAAEALLQNIRESNQAAALFAELSQDLVAIASDITKRMSTALKDAAEGRPRGPGSAPPDGWFGFKARVDRLTRELEATREWYQRNGHGKEFQEPAPS